MNERGFNKRSFAMAIGILPATLQHIMGPRMTQPGLEILQKIVETFPDLNARWLLTGKGEMFEKNKPEAESIKNENLSYFINEIKELKEENRLLKKLSGSAKQQHR